MRETEAEKKPTAVEEVKRAIEALTPKERGFLRPWLLAHFDVAGNVRE